MNNGLRPVGMTGIGCYVPPRVLTNFDLEKMVDTSDEWIRTRSGISERHIVDPGMGASDLAVPAALEALERAKVAPSDLDMIIVCTTSPDMMFPATACLVQDRIKATKAGAFDLSAGCTGLVYGLAVGSQMIATGAYQAVLVIGAEALSTITDWTDRSTCVLLGDGAGALVLQPTDQSRGIRSFYLRSDGAGGDLLKLPAGGSRLPASEQTVRNRQHFIWMVGREIFKFSVVVLEEATRKVVERAGLTLDDVALVVPHQANSRIIDTAAKRLELPKDRFMYNVDKYGNTSTASIPIALYEAIEEGRVKQGDHVVLVAFGAGLTWGAVLLTL